MSAAFREKFSSVLSDDLSVQLPELILPTLAPVEGAPARFSIDGDPERPQFALAGLIRAVDDIRVQRAQGKLLHSMNPDTKGLLAEFGLVTTVEPRYPPRLAAYQTGRRTEMTLGTVGIRAFESLSFEPPVTVERLEAICDVTGLQLHNIHSAPTKHGEKAIVDRTDFIFPSFAQAEALRGVFDDWLRTTSNRSLYRVRTTPMSRVADGLWNERENTGPIEGDWAVVVHGLDEYAMREMASASGEMQMLEDRQRFLAMRPPGKQAPPFWFNNETFPAEMLARWRRRDQKYQKLPVLASYGPGEELAPVPSHELLLMTEITHMFQRFRDGIRPVVRAIHGRNILEINPNEDERIILFRGLELMRVIIPPDENFFAPVMPYAPSGIEKGRMQTMELLTEFRAAYRENPLKALRSYGVLYGPKLVAATVGLGIESGVEALVQAAPWAGKAGTSFLDDLSTLSRRKSNALAGGTRVDTMADHIEAEYRRLSLLR